MCQARGPRAPSQHDLEEAVVGADEPAPAGADHRRAARPADAGIDDAQEHGSGREGLRQRREQVGGALDPKGRQVVDKVDDRHAGRVALEGGHDLAGVQPRRAEIGEQHDHR